MNLWIRETWVNATTHITIGDSGIYETKHVTLGELFESLQKLYGRCTGPCFLEEDEDGTHQCGWVFLKKDLYEDATPYKYKNGGRPLYRQEDYYLKETWVEVWNDPPVLIPAQYEGGTHPFEKSA